MHSSSCAPPLSPCSSCSLVTGGCVVMARRPGPRRPRPPRAGRAGRPGAAQRQDRDRGCRAARGAGARHPRRPHRGARHRAPRSQPYIGPATKVDRPEGRARPSPASSRATATSSGIGQAQARPRADETTSWDEIVAMVRRGREEGEARRVDRRPRLAPGEVDDAARRRTSRASRRTRRSTAVSPDNPVLLTHASGHATLRQRARRWSWPASPSDTPNPPGGEILKDAQGNPIGVFRETASGLLRRAHAGAAREDDARASVEAERAAVIELAVAGVPVEGHHVVPGRRRRRSQTIDLLKQMVDRRQAGRAALGDAAREQRAARRDEPGAVPDRSATATSHLTVRAIKRRWTARSGRAARGCSSRTPTCRPAPA